MTNPHTHTHNLTQKGTTGSKKKRRKKRKTRTHPSPTRKGAGPKGRRTVAVFGRRVGSGRRPLVAWQDRHRIWNARDGMSCGVYCVNCRHSPRWRHLGADGICFLSCGVPRRAPLPQWRHAPRRRMTRRHKKGPVVAGGGLRHREGVSSPVYFPLRWENPSLPKDSSVRLGRSPMGDLNGVFLP